MLQLDTYLENFQAHSYVKHIIRAYLRNVAWMGENARFGIKFIERIYAHNYENVLHAYNN